MQLEEKVLAIIRSNTERAPAVTLASDLRKELRLDSFGTLMIINAIEDTFAITVDEADFTRLNTVAEVISLLASKYHCE
jgi:acyl carrier protein